jgi:hypothetical protein
MKPPIYIGTAVPFRRRPFWKPTVALADLELGNAGSKVAFSLTSKIPGADKQAACAGGRLISRNRPTSHRAALAPVYSDPDGRGDRADEAEAIETFLMV